MDDVDIARQLIESPRWSSPEARGIMATLAVMATSKLYPRLVRLISSFVTPLYHLVKGHVVTIVVIIFIWVYVACATALSDSDVADYQHVGLEIPISVSLRPKVEN